LKIERDEPLSRFAFDFSLRRYSQVRSVNGVNVTSPPLLTMEGVAEFEYPCDLGVGPDA
jgi:hypothetical protein